MDLHSGHGSHEEEHDEEDADKTAKLGAMKSLSKHIGADDSSSESESDDGPLGGEPEGYNGAIPWMEYKRKNKKSGGKGGMPDISSIAGMMG